jgi:hypothetical protein
MGSETNEGLAWEQLVTEGHVRAARLRWMQPWLVTIGAGFLVIGFYLAAGVSVPVASVSATDELASEVSAAQKPVIAAINSLPKLQFGDGAAPQLVAAGEVGAALIPLILEELKKTNRLPSDQIEIAITPVNEFWRKEWPHDKLIATGNDSVKLVGAVVNAGGETYITPRRWLGIFRKASGKWQYATADGGEFIEIGNQPHVAPEAIPITLASVLPEGR